MKSTTTSEAELTATNLVIAFIEATNRYQMFGSDIHAEEIEAIVNEMAEFVKDQNVIISGC